MKDRVMGFSTFGREKIGLQQLVTIFFSYSEFNFEPKSKIYKFSFYSNFLKKKNKF